jgi:hypothetical protein
MIKITFHLVKHIMLSGMYYKIYKNNSIFTFFVKIVQFQRATGFWSNKI